MKQVCLRSIESKAFILTAALSSLWAGPIAAQTLPPAFFQVAVQARSNSFNDDALLDNRGAAINASLDLTGTDSHGFFSQFVGEARTTGGMKPMADVQGSAIFASGNAIATLSYAFRATPVNPAVIAPGPVPVFMDAAASIDVTTDPANVTDIGGRAFFRIDEAADAFRDPQLRNFGPGFRGFEIDAIIDDNGIGRAEFAATYRLGLSPSGAIHGITLFANGATGNAPVDSSFEFQSVIDPVFRIDPDASFDVSGVRVSFADAYRLEFSEGVVPFVVPEPSSLMMMLGLGLMIAAGTVRRHRSRA